MWAHYFHVGSKNVIIGYQKNYGNDKIANKSIERDAGIAVFLFHFCLCAPAPLMPGVIQRKI